LNYIYLLAMRKLLYLFAIVILGSCQPEKLPDEIDTTQADPVGTLQVKFEIKHPWIPKGRIIRAGLHIAPTAMELFRGEYIQSANVNNYNEFYTFHLPPGSYYLEAIIACICGGDSCSAGGFPGYAPSTKHTAEKFLITEDETTTVIPNFQ
jgi:hypothetical protein